MPPGLSTQNVFRYRSLADPSYDIRLLHLLPYDVDADEPIRINIEHASLPEYSETDLIVPSQKHVLEQVQKTLPSEWSVHETLEGRLIYNHDDSAVETSWNHPTKPDFRPPTLPIQTVPGTPHYEALSYTWGAPGGNHLVWIQYPDNSTQEVYAVLPVTENLSITLRHLRLPKVPRIIWIDAICINQSDITERNLQVQRMTHIYRLASNLVVWLGPEKDDSNLAISTLEFLAEQVDITRHLYNINRPGCFAWNTQDWYLFRTDLPYDEQTWRSLESLFHREWFTRVWVLQEIALVHPSRAIVQCGKVEITWSAMRRAIICLSSRNNLGPSLSTPSSRTKFRNYMLDVARVAEYNPAHSLALIVRYFDSRCCADPRDRVYGLMGLMSEKLRAQIKVDYDLGVLEVYKQFALAQMSHFGRLDPLAGCYGFNKSSSGTTTAVDKNNTHASWVPDLRRPALGVRLRRGQFSAGISRAIFRNPEPNMLEVAGTEPIPVMTVENKMADETTAGDVLQVIRKWNLRERLEDKYPSNRDCNISFLEAFAMTLSRCGLFLRDKAQFANSYPSLEEWMNFCREVIINRSGTTTTSTATFNREGEREDPEADDTNNDPIEPRGMVTSFFLDYIRASLVNRRLFFTRDGLVGLGPVEMLPGDLVTVLLGYDAPVVLRQTAEAISSNNSDNSHQSVHYRLIGEATVYGLHDGIALLGPLPANWAGQVFLDSVGQPTVYRYLDKTTGQVTDDDPRLGPLPPGWEYFQRDRTADDPDYFQEYCYHGRDGTGGGDDGSLRDGVRDNNFPGEERTGAPKAINYDPRMEIDELQSRGVKFTMYQLV